MKVSCLEDGGVAVIENETSLVVRGSCEIGGRREPLRIAYNGCMTEQMIAAISTALPSCAENVPDMRDANHFVTRWEELLNSLIDYEACRIAPRADTDLEYWWRVSLKVSCVSDNGRVRDLGLAACFAALKSMKIPQNLVWDASRKWWKYAPAMSDVVPLPLKPGVIPVSVTVVAADGGGWTECASKQHEATARTALTVHALFQPDDSAHYLVEHIGVIDSLALYQAATATAKQLSLRNFLQLKNLFPGT